MINWSLIYLIGVFSFIVVMHVYLRARLLRTHRQLVSGGVQLQLGAMFSRRGVADVIEKYPGFATELKDFSRNLRISLLLTASVICGAIIFALFIK